VEEPYFTEGVEDSVSIGTSCDRSHTLHLRKSSAASRDDVRETRNDLWEGALANNDQRGVDEGDGLGWGLEVLALLGDHLNVGDDLGRSGLCHDGGGEGNSRSEEGAERDHFCGGGWMRQCLECSRVLRR
jgi:hypothetical protein